MANRLARQTGGDAGQVIGYEVQASRDENQIAGYETQVSRDEIQVNGNEMRAGGYERRVTNLGRQTACLPGQTANPERQVGGHAVQIANRAKIRTTCAAAQVTPHPERPPAPRSWPSPPWRNRPAPRQGSAAPRHRFFAPRRT
ncbi:MAG TPA: hypothetical protein DD490_33565 [Acidobacteria bacterium]|nr:hypothetical protein [Acidobacteriota bacterium]